MERIALLSGIRILIVDKAEEAEYLREVKVVETSPDYIKFEEPDAYYMGGKKTWWISKERFVKKYDVVEVLK